ncbi:immunity 49 family protein [Streptomyces sp. NPDC047002]|uniref:immunity 49 family protein n=1 Tax=Streptomyces sp. NPDC047002 TaxID=3155475 RepID=UPI00345607C7
MVEVSRHYGPHPNAENYAAMLGESVEEGIGYLVRDPSFFGSTLSSAELHVQARCLIDPRAAEIETWEAVVTAMQIGSALFAAATAPPGTTIEARINHEIRTIGAIGAVDCVDPGNWLTAFWFAIICRDQKRMTQLCEVPLDLFRQSQRETGWELDEYAFQWVDTLQAYWLRRPGVAEKLTRTIQLSHPDTATIAPKDLLNQILYQPINLFHRFVTHDTDGYNKALYEALEYHKTYWTADEDREDDPSANVALGPLAITCLAHDGEFPLNVTSDYLPHHLVQRSWLGEFPT